VKMVVFVQRGRILLAIADYHSQATDFAWCEYFIITLALCSAFREVLNVASFGMLP